MSIITRDTTLGVVEVWRARVDRPASDVRELAMLLDQDERSRAERFVRAEDRTRFIVSHGVLRKLLAERLGSAAAAIRFEVLRYGKPFVPDSDWQFSLSHSGDFMLCAFARNLQVGADIEQMRLMPDYEAIAERYFANEERRQLRELPDGRRQEGFFRIWTLKEAYLKATGEGLNFPLSDFDVSLSPVGLLRAAGRPDEEKKWGMAAFSPHPGYQGAIAVEGGQCQLTHHSWDF